MINSKGYKIFQVINTLVLILIFSVTLFPFIYILSLSLSNHVAVMSGKVTVYPIGINVNSYKHIMTQGMFWTGYKNTFFYTIFGTIVGLVLSTMCAYPLSKKNLPGSNFILKFIVFTMFFSGGLIPTYLIVQKLNLIDTVWAMVIPGGINAYNVLVMKTFFQGIPSSLEESGEIDGLNQIGILIRIILPLSKPIIATMTLFIAVVIWNDWFKALIYLNKDSLYPVTLFLRNIVMGSLMSAKDGKQVEGESIVNLPQTLQSATIILVTLPILCIYPFIQKYFVKGVMIGAIKG